MRKLPLLLRLAFLQPMLWSVLQSGAAGQATPGQLVAWGKVSSRTSRQPLRSPGLLPVPTTMWRSRPTARWWRGARTKSARRSRRQTLRMCSIWLPELTPLSPFARMAACSHGQASSTLDGVSNAVVIAAGWSHYLVLKGDGTAIGWGYNNQGDRTPSQV